MNELNKSITFTTASHGIPMKVNEFKSAKRLENLLDIGLGKVEV